MTSATSSSCAVAKRNLYPRHAWLNPDVAVEMGRRRLTARRRVRPQREGPPPVSAEDSNREVQCELYGEPLAEKMSGSLG